MGWIQIVCCLGLHCFVIFGLGLTEGDHKLEIVSSAVFFLITGLLSVIDFYYNNQCLVIIKMLMSIISIAAAKALFSFSLVNAVRGITYKEIMTYSCIAVNGLVLEVTYIVIFGLSCLATCGGLKK